MALIWYKMPGLSSGLSFNNETFFLVLLPFIIFESGFSVHRQSLFRNMGSILMFAIIGTFLSAFGIGGFLFAMIKARGTTYDFSFLDCMIIGAVMSSTDPVATLSIVRSIFSLLICQPKPCASCHQVAILCGRVNFHNSEILCVIETLRHINPYQTVNNPFVNMF